MQNGKPTIIIAKTKKGAGLPGMSGHGAVAKQEDLLAARRLIDRSIAQLAGNVDMDDLMGSVIQRLELTQHEKADIDLLNQESYEKMQEYIEEGEWMQKCIACMQFIVKKMGR